MEKMKIDTLIEMLKTFKRESIKLERVRNSTPEPFDSTRAQRTSHNARLSRQAEYVNNLRFRVEDSFRQAIVNGIDV